jgi:hypothetical protein
MSSKKKRKPVARKARAKAKVPARKPAKAPKRKSAKAMEEVMAGDVVIGIIDDALAFAQERFRIGDKTRVEFVWLQDGAYPSPGTPIYVGSPPVPYGLELAKEDQLPYKGIDSLLAECTYSGAIDEDEVYRRTGLIDFRRAGHKAVAWRIAHGTHVMDLAAGEDPASRCEDRPIVCVQLPAMTTADTSGADLATYALDAIEYILLRADEIAAKRGVPHLPVVINFSYGMTGGPHDGTSELEEAIDALVAWRNEVCEAPLAVVLPAGNSHLSRCHATVSFEEAGEVAELEWRILPDDWTSSFLEIWMPYRPASAGTASRVEITLVTPGGTELAPWIGEVPGAIFEWPSGADPVCAARYIYVPIDTERGMFLVTIAPTFSLDPAVATAPAGTWTLKIKNLAMPAGAPIQTWVRRDDTLYGHPRRGRQSHFDAACYRRFDHMGYEEEKDQPGCPVRRAGLLNAIATGREPVVVGAMLQKQMVASKYSAAGPTTPPRGASTAYRDGPDALTVGDDSRVHTGVLAAGARSGSVVAMNGTSVAAPQIAREIARRMATGAPYDRAAVQGIAAYQEANAPPPGRPAVTPPLPNARYGEGRIESPFPPAERSIMDNAVPRPRFIAK